MAINFPNNPALNDTFTVGSLIFTFDGVSWKSITTSAPPQTVSVGDGPPGSPVANTLWWQSNTLTLKVYYADSNSSQWVDANPSATITTLSNGHIFVGSNTNVATDVAMTGDVTISNTGVTAIGAGKVTAAMLASPLGSWVLIANASPVGVNTVTFSSISNTYSHLLVMVSGRTDRAVAQDQASLRFNSDTGANYDFQTVQLVSGSIGPDSAANQTSISVFSILGGSSAPSGMGGYGEAFIYNYKNTSLYKILRMSRGGSDSGAVSSSWVTEYGQAQWRNANAITQIDITLVSTGNFVAGSYAALYGIY